LKALADRAATGAVGDLRLYYYESARIAGDTVLRYELNDRILPYCMFITGVERALIKRGMEDGGRKVVYYVPSKLPSGREAADGGDRHRHLRLHRLADGPPRLYELRQRQRLFDEGLPAPRSACWSRSTRTCRGSMAKGAQLHVSEVVAGLRLSKVLPDADRTHSPLIGIRLTSVPVVNGWR
jgi:hypothetical protein